MEEIWKDIKGYEGLYQVSSQGRVRSLARVDCGGRILKGKIMSNVRSGLYRGINLRKNGKMVRYYIHRLVAETFLPNNSNLPQVNHKNEDKTDNRLVNLEWCDRKYNINFGTGRKRHFERLKTKRAVIQLSIDGKEIARFPSIRYASRSTGVNRRGIEGCCMNKPMYNTAGGYKWKYQNQTL